MTLSIRYLAYDLNIYGVPLFDGSEPPPDLSDPDAVQRLAGERHLEYRLLSVLLPRHLADPVAAQSVSVRHGLRGRRRRRPAQRHTRRRRQSRSDAFFPTRRRAKTPTSANYDRRAIHLQGSAQTGAGKSDGRADQSE